MKFDTRNPGPIPPLSRTMNARRWLFFQTKTTTQFLTAYKQRLNFLLGYAVYCEFDAEYNMTKMEEYEIKTTEDFGELLARKARGKGLLYATSHNLPFDLQILALPQLLERQGWTSKLPILSGHIALWQAKIGAARVHFLSAQNLFPGRLEELGETIGRKRKFVSRAERKHAPLMEGCKNDCHILRVAFTKYLQWLHDNELGYFAETTSWQAFVAFRTRFLQVPIHIHVDYSILGYEREAYYGARTECFFVGEAPVQPYFLLDVNSMYAHVMKENPYPVEFMKLAIRPSVQTLLDLAREFYVIAKVELDCDEAAYPFRAKSKLVFPTGRYSTWLHAPEIQVAAQSGAISRVHFCLAYRQDSVFGPYVDFFADRKRRASDSGDRAGERLAKQFLVSLYGKFGQRNSKTFDQGKSNYPGIRAFHAKAAGSSLVWDEIHWLGTVYQVYKSGEKPYACPSIAGAITAYGRMFLYQLIQEAGSSHVYYCDTDSLLVDQAGFENLRGRLDDSLLGRLKCVSRSNALAIFGPKDYTVGEIRRRKGVGQPVDGNRDGGVRNEQIRSLSWRMKSGNLDGVDVYEVLKHRVATYDKGRVLPGGRVLPWSLPADADQPVFQA